MDLPVPSRASTGVEHYGLIRVNVMLTLSEDGRSFSGRASQGCTASGRKG